MDSRLCGGLLQDKKSREREMLIPNARMVAGVFYLELGLSPIAAKRSRRKAMLWVVVYGNFFSND
jgi:hypothetical protein